MAPSPSERCEALESETEQRPQALANVVENVGGRRSGKRCISRLPSEVLHVVGEHDPGDGAIVGQRDLERIALRMARDWTRNGELNFCVVDARR